MSVVVSLVHSLRLLVRSRAVLHLEITVAERVRGTRHRAQIRRECLDHVIVMNAAGLRRLLTEYVAHYLRSRTHLALGKDTPITRPIRPPSAGRIVAMPEVGGLHHRYDRAAA